LAYAHYRGIAHRDIKPENVVFCTKEPDDNRVKVIDWGLATNFTETSMTKAVGSMTYAAPEVIASNDTKVYTQACDVWSVGVLAYVMLCGKPPFWGSRDQHYKNAKNERYPFKDAPWDRMNENVKDFVRKLLKAKPSDRLPIEKVVQHPWLVSPPSEAADSVISADVVKNLKAFSAQTTFSRICITAVARQLDHKQLKDVHQVFRAMDLDGNGVLTSNEVKAGLQKMGGLPPGINMDELFANLDMDGSHTIDYTEFCAAGLGQNQATKDDVIWAAFKTFDQDNTGFITVENLKNILDHADVKDSFSADVCETVGREIVAQFDKDGDGSISFEDWRALMLTCWEKKQDAPSDGGAYDLLLKVSALN
jgi:calcium-dependent protein kinase